ncbi:hypothetical protein [Exiguobacterium sp. s138]|uniref:hypothetical protein n=1 Tax=Exiguobacterium sp. s138 TaxID=2751202 RepID=UPI001BE94ACA|nr:hypothetical protein [Exiguobacterium sp. s138]
MSILTALQSKEFIASITTLVSTVVGALIAIYANSKNQKSSAKRKYGEEVLIEVYIPLMVIVEDKAINDAEYPGLDIDDINSMLRVIRNKLHLVDRKLYKILYSYQWENRESWDYLSKEEYKNQVYDLDREFLDRLYYVIENTKKEIGVSYDKSIKKNKIRWRNKNSI